MKYLFFILLIGASSAAQTWSTSIDAVPEGFPPNSDYGKEIVSYKNGYIILSAATCNLSYVCMALIYLDSVGNHLKTVTLNDPIHPYSSIGVNLLHVDEENSVFIAAGKYNSESDKLDVVLIKLDSEGQIIWEQSYPGSYRNYPRTMIRKADGGFLIHCDGRPDSESRTDVSIIETDSDGNLIDEVSLNLRDTLEISQYGSAAIADDSSIFVACISINFENEPFEQTSYLVKLNKEKEVVWLKKLYPVKSICAASIRKTLDDHIIFSACVDTLIWPFNNPIVLHVVKFDLDGNVVFETMLDSDIIRKQFSMTVTSENDVLLFGEIQSFEFPKNKGWIAKFNSSTDLLWEKSYYIEGAHRDQFFFGDVQELPDESLIATGFIIDTLPDGTLNGNTWILKLDKNGCYDPDNCDDEVIITSFSNVSIPKSNDIAVYPSLSNGMVTLKIPESINGLDLQVVDLQGKPVFQKKNVTEGETIMIDQAGTFIFRFTHKNTMVATRKIISVGR